MPRTMRIEKVLMEFTMGNQTPPNMGANWNRSISMIAMLVSEQSLVSMILKLLRSLFMLIVFCHGGLRFPSSHTSAPLRTQADYATTKTGIPSELTWYFLAISTFNDP